MEREKLNAEEALRTKRVNSQEVVDVEVEKKDLLGTKGSGKQFAAWWKCEYRPSLLGERGMKRGHR